MAITPMDIHNKEFSKSFRGFNPDEVDQFLDEVVEDYERIYKENLELKDRINVLTEQISQFKLMEATLKETLVTAQRAADETTAAAQKKAEVIVAQAEDQAQRIINKANDEVMQLQNEFVSLQKKAQVYKTKLKSVIQAQLELLDNDDF